MRHGVQPSLRARGRPVVAVHAQHRRDLGRPVGDDDNLAWTRAFWDDAHRFATAGKTYFNFPGLLEEGAAAVETSFGPNHDRLARIKAVYDPENRFRANANVLPAG